jgi:hypothetical protein
MHQLDAVRKRCQPNARRGQRRRVAIEADQSRGAVLEKRMRGKNKNI